MSWAQGNEEPHKPAVRASIVARKRGNDRGAKGRRKMERKGTQMSEENLSAVTLAKEPKPDKEALRARWNWVEHTVWTDPMLRTLEIGIKGGRKGKAKGLNDHTQWPNRFYDEAGLFNLTAARVKGR
jgi:hypothetical protein